MTVSSTSSRVVYAGNGIATVWPFAFKVGAAADLVVVHTDAGGTDLTLTASQYGATGFGADAGGTVTYPLSGAPIATGTRLTIYRDVAVTQPAQISNQGAMWPAVIEAALDRLTFIAQKVADAVSRSLVVSPTDPGSLAPLPNATQRAHAVLGFDGAGQPYAAQLVAGLGAASAWLVANFFPAASQAAARAALDVPSLAEVAAEIAAAGDGAIAIAAPPGAVVAFAGSATPAGWLLCAGQEASRTGRAALFAAIGTSYGAGDGTTTFNLPDLRGRVAAGRDNMGGSDANRMTSSGTGNPGIDANTLGAAGGDDRHTLTAAQMPAHTHTARIANGGASDSVGGAILNSQDGETTPAGGGEAHPIVQPTIILNFIIKT